MSALHKVATPCADAPTTSDSIPVTAPNPVTANVRFIP